MRWGAVVALAVAGCNVPPTLVSEAPIPVSLESGVLLALGSLDGSPTFPLLIDTGTVLTSRHTDGAPSSTLHTLRVWDRDGRPRAEFDLVSVLTTPLGQVGVGRALLDLTGGASGTPGGILGGDLLQWFSVKLDYSTGAPTVSLLPGDTACSCAVADEGRVQLGFTLAGGGTFQLGDGTILTYPPTRVTLDACLEPNTDPLSRGQTCLSGGERTDGGVVVGGSFNDTEYAVDGLPGTDVKLLVATGFPGVLLGTSVWDRMRGQGAAEALLAAGNLTDLHFAGRATPVPAAHATLGNDDPAVHRLALALIDRQGLLGACGELNRSRRLRAYSTTPTTGDVGPNCDDNDACPPGLGPTSCLQCASSPGAACTDERGIDRCNDRKQSATAYIELSGPIDVWVVDDGAPILQEVNFDVRPALPDVEGVIGTELLARLAARIDYPNGRVEAGCACVPGCTAYPAWTCPALNDDCGRSGQNALDLCTPPSAIHTVGAPLPTTCAPDGGM